MLNLQVKIFGHLTAANTPVCGVAAQVFKFALQHLLRAAPATLWYHAQCWPDVDCTLELPLAAAGVAATRAAAKDMEK